jgi:hypothetical protein
MGRSDSAIADRASHYKSGSRLRSWKFISDGETDDQRKLEVEVSEQQLEGITDPNATHTYRHYTNR